MNWKTYSVLAALLAASVYALAPGGARPPSDLRDAPSDNSAMAQLGGESPGQEIGAPTPAEAAPSPASGEDKMTLALARISGETGAAGGTPFEILADLFDKAGPASAGDTVGWYYTLVARSPEKTFYGVSGGAQVEGEGDKEWVRTGHMTYHTGFDLDTQVTPQMMEKHRDFLDKSPVVVGFPNGEWKKGASRTVYRKHGRYVIVKNSGVKISGAKPPFDHPVFYICYVKKI